MVVAGQLPWRPESNCLMAAISWRERGGREGGKEGGRERERERERERTCMDHTSHYCTVHRFKLLWLPWQLHVHVAILSNQQISTCIYLPKTIVPYQHVQICVNVQTTPAQYAELISASCQRLHHLSAHYMALMYCIVH